MFNFWDGLYRVEEDGKVFRMVGVECLKERYIKQYKTKNGYMALNLSINSKSKRMLVHRLVALTYISNPNNLPQVDHIDRNKQNNHISNLRWVTNQENRENTKVGKSGYRNISINPSGSYAIQFIRNKKIYTKCLPSTYSIEEVWQERLIMLESL